jgi:RNA polymerase sigma-70 factor (ECF subfamily)
VRAQGSGPEARTALEALVRRYQRTVELMLLSRKRPPGLSTEDLRQDFFTAFLRCDDVLKLDRERGKFRTWLHVAVRRFVAKRWRQWFRENPIDGVNAPRDFEVIERFDQATGDRELHVVDVDTPDVAFMRRFAEDTLLQAVERHRAEATDKRLFDRIVRFLPGPAMSLDGYAPVAAELGMTAETLAVRVSRLRVRHKLILRTLIADTLDADPNDPEGAAAIAAEMRELSRVLRGAPVPTSV